MLLSVVIKERGLRTSVRQREEPNRHTHCNPRKTSHTVVISWRRQLLYSTLHAAHADYQLLQSTADYRLDHVIELALAPLHILQVW